MNAIDHAAFRLPAVPTAETLATVQTASEVHALYFSLITVMSVVDAAMARDSHMDAYSQMVDRDIWHLASRAGAMLSTCTDADDRRLLRRVVLDFEMRCELPGEEFQALTDQAIARAAA